MEKKSNLENKSKGVSPKFWFFSVLAVSAGVGFWLGSSFHKNVNAEKAPYKELEKFAKVLQFVEANYVDRVAAGDLIEGAIRGMFLKLDPHSAYLNAELFRDMKSETAGKFGGLGIEVTIKDGFITVVAPIEDTPAFKAGIRSGDQIVKIDSRVTKTLTVPEAVGLMRGKPGTPVKVLIQRKGSLKPLEFVLNREFIKIQSVKYSRAEGDIGYFRISSFIEKTAEDLAGALEKLNKQKPIVGMVLDLRGNPGGLLEQAIRVSNLFLDEGPIVYTIGRDKEKKEIEFAQKGRKVNDLPLVVLVDGSSASASEIVAGALQDYGRAVIAGQQTFGKGSVQSVIPMDDESGIKVTVSRYYTPAGNSIQVKGISPDVTLDYLDPKIVAEARKRTNSRMREVDLENHFENEASPDSEIQANKDAGGVEETSAEGLANLSLEERVKKDYMIHQAVGILKTMKLVRNGNKKPDFKLDTEDDSRKSRAKNSSALDPEAGSL